MWGIQNSMYVNAYMYLFPLFLSVFKNRSFDVKWHFAIKLTYTVVEAPTTFIAMVLWHTMDYLMPWQSMQWGEQLHAHLTLQHAFRTSVQNPHWICFESFTTLLAGMGICVLIHMFSVHNKLWECNIAVRTHCLTNGLQLFSLKQQIVYVTCLGCNKQKLHVMDISSAINSHSA